MAGETADMVRLSHLCGWASHCCSTTSALVPWDELDGAVSVENDFPSSCSQGLSVFNILDSLLSLLQDWGSLPQDRESWRTLGLNMLESETRWPAHLVLNKPRSIQHFTISFTLYHRNKFLESPWSKWGDSWFIVSLPTDSTLVAKKLQTKVAVLFQQSWYIVASFILA